jgi:hypothetical protein
MTKESVIQKFKKFYNNVFKKSPTKREQPPQIKRVKEGAVSSLKTKKLLKSLGIVKEFYKKFPSTDNTENIRRAIRYINYKLRVPMDFNTKHNLMNIRKGLLNNL